MGFNLGTSSNTGKLHMTDFLKTDNAVQNTEKEIPINQLVPWENQPFKMYGEFKLHELAESIKENGLLSPIIVCPLDNGKYRIIAGHNRVEVCKIAGITNIPSVVKNVDENRAKLMMADTNLCQRTELLPSERAYAYKAQHEALIALGSPRSTAAIAEKYGEGRATVQRMDEQLYNEYRGIMAMLKQTIEDVHKFQDEETGMFWQVMDHPGVEGNYLETSGTALFAYAVLKGVRLGYLPKRMAAWAEKAFYGTCDKYLSKNPDGSLQLGGICLVAGLGGKDHRDGSLAYYFSEPVVCNDAKGVGPLVLAYTEMIARK